MLWPYMVMIVQTLLEGRIDRPRPPHVEYHRVSKMPYPDAFTFETSNGTQVILSPEDKHLATDRKWRISTAGYVVSSSRKSGKYELTYLHKVVAGTSAKHMNSDRLDNRRCNLIESKPRFTRKRVFDMSTDDFEITTIAPFLDHDLVPREAPFKSNHSTVHYGHGKIYRGAFLNHKPHGYGMLLEDNSEDESRSSIGYWENGLLTWGLVVVFKQTPAWMKTGWEHKEIHYVYPVRRT